MLKYRTSILSAAALGTLLFFTGGPSGVGIPIFPADEAFAGNNGNGNGKGNGKSGNSGNRGNSGNQASSASPGNNAGGNSNIETASGGIQNRGQAKKAEKASIQNTASSKMKPKDILAEYGIKPNKVPGGWMGALMGDRNQRANQRSVHGKARTALSDYKAVGVASSNYQSALDALAADPELTALNPASPTYDEQVAALANQKIDTLNKEIAQLDMENLAYDADKAALEAKKADWQAVLDTQSAVQMAQADFEQSFEDVTKGKTPYSEPLAGQVMMIYEEKVGG